MENIASDAGFNLKNVTPGQIVVPVATPVPTPAAGGAAVAPVATPAVDPNAIPKPKPYTFTVTFDGTYTSLQKFLADLELYSRPMRVQSIKLSGAGSALSGTVDVQTFYQDKATLPFVKETIK
jgi:hypothetical protein